MSIVKRSIKSKLSSNLKSSAKGKNHVQRHRNSECIGPPSRQKLIATRLMIDVLNLGLVAVVYFTLEVVVPPFYRGMFCDDERIHYPFRESRVSTTLMIVTGILIGIVLICPMEVLYSQMYGSDPAYRRPAQKLGVPPLLYYLYTYLGTYTFVNFVCQTLTDVCKLSVGSLRPHFIHVCKPDFSQINCSAGYIADFNCTADDVGLYIEARKSFVSGHASFCFTCSAFLILYLQWRLVWRPAVLLRVTIQGSLVAITLWVCSTRLQDNMHHWEDIVAGGIMGFISGIVGALFISGTFMEKRPTKMRATSCSSAMTEESSKSQLLS